MRYAYLFLISILAIGFFGCDRAEDPIVGMDALSAVYVGAINGTAGSYCTKLYAGQNIEAGLVCAEVIDNGDSETLCITYTTTGGWQLQETHLWVGEALADMPQTRKGNPQVGLFPYASGTLAAGTTTYQFCIDLSQFGAEGGTDDLCGEILYAAAHAVVAKDNNGDGSYDQTETGWGNGNPMVSKGNWATYFTITLACQTGGGGGGGTETGETAFAYNCDDNARTCFLDIDEDGDGTFDFNRWGWTNGPLGPGTYYFDIYAGAGQCDIGKGTLVGLLKVQYDGQSAVVTYKTGCSYSFSELHLYVGNEILARKNGEYTVAPGQYPNIAEDLDVTEYTFTVPASGLIYVVAHAVVVGDYSQGDCGERGCEPCIPGPDIGAVPGILDNLDNTDNLISMAVTYDQTGAGSSEFVGYFSMSGSASPSSYDYALPTWCVDLDHYVYPYNSPWNNTTPYCAKWYSSYATLPAGLLEKPQNLDLVNWIINQGFVGTPSDGGLGNYTVGDVQMAIWTLVEDNIAGGNTTPYLQARVDQIVAKAAAQGENYVPPCNGYVGIIVVPGGDSSGRPGACDSNIPSQVLIAQVLMTQISVPCNECPY